MISRYFKVVSSNLLSALIASALILYLANNVTPQEFSGFFLIYLLANFACGSISSSLGTLYLMGDTSASKRHSIQNTWLSLIYITSFLGIIPVLTPVLQTFLIIFSGLMFNSYLGYQFNRKRAYWAYSFNNLIFNILRFFFVIVTISMINNITYLEIHFISSLFILGFQYAYAVIMHVPMRVDVQLTLKQFREIKFNLSTKLVIVNAIFMFCMLTDRLILDKLYGPEATALLIFWHQWSFGLVSLVFNPIKIIMQPLLLEGKKYTWEYSNYPMIFIAIPLFIFMVYLYTIIIANLSPTHFQPAIDLIWSGIILGCAFSIAQISNLHLLGRQKLRPYMKLIMISSLVGLMAQGFLIPLFGFLGAVLSITLLIFFYSGYSHLLRKRLTT